MVVQKFHHSMVTIVVLLGLSLTSFSQAETRSYPNPLNKQRVDLFFVVDQRPQYMTKPDFVFLKTAIIDIVGVLNPSGSDPCFGSYFYGPTTTISSPFAFCTKSVAAVSSALNLLVYPVAQSNPTTLTDALNTVITRCTSGCRSDVSRVTLIISANLDSSAASIIRQMEQYLGMIVIVLAVGTDSNKTANAQLLASYPQNDFALSVGTYNAISAYSNYFKSIISDVPRPFPIQSSVSISPAANGIFHSLQINTAGITVTNEAIIMLASSCANCYTYASLSELIPSDVNSPVFVGRQFYLGTGSYSYISFFRVPRNTTRVFVSFKGDGSATAYFTCDLISLPTAMVFPMIGTINLEGPIIG